MSKVIAIIKGGLGNQLFCYSAARRLALVNEAELVIDHVSGFTRDFKYKRRFCLDQFNISGRKASSKERLEPLGRYRRALMKWANRKKPFSRRRYIEQEALDFDERLLSFKVDSYVYLDGYWQSERYFKDIEETIRRDLIIIPPKDKANLTMADHILSSNAVAIHVRFFNPCSSNNYSYHILKNYYLHALERIRRHIEYAEFFIFSDNPSIAKKLIHWPKGCSHFLEHNSIDDAHADLWLMTLCKHFIIANSTFSWWGAWLSRNKTKIIIAPKIQLSGIGAWGFAGLLPQYFEQI